MEKETYTITKSQWDLFVWMLDCCEKKQNNACKGCGLMDDCINLYKSVANLCKVGDMETYKGHENSHPSIGNPMVEGHENDLDELIVKNRRGLKLVKQNGVPVV